jgi:hypothetical protein
METSRSFTTKNPDIIHQMCMCLVAVMVAIMVFFTLIDGPELAMYITFTVLFVIPFSIGALWSKRKYIRVDGTTITVRNGLALFPFEISVYDIKHVKAIVTHSHNSKNINMKIFTEKGKKFAVETTMVNSGKMFAYINERVSPQKIQVVQKNFNNSN